MKKFSIGQSVSVKNGLISGHEYGNVLLLDNMNVPEKIFTIMSITSCGNYLTDSGFIFSEEMLNEANDFNSAWKPGNIVIDTNNVRYYIISNQWAVSLHSSISRDVIDSFTKIIYHNPDHYGLGFNYNLGIDMRDIDEHIIWENKNEIIKLKIADLKSTIKSLNEEIKNLESQLQ